MEDGRWKQALAGPVFHLSIFHPPAWLVSLFLRCWHDLVGDGLNQGFCFEIGRDIPLSPALSHGMGEGEPGRTARHSWSPLVVVAELTFLEAKARVRNAQALL